MKYSSSVVKIFEEYCPKALAFYESNTPMFKDIFQAGVAAHHVLQSIGEKKAVRRPEQIKVADAVSLELITKGRSFRGVQEPPIAPTDAIEGRELALDFLTYSQIPTDNIWFEKEFSAESLNLNYVGLIDAAYIETRGGEEYEYNAFVVRDYKSAWVARENELDTFQRRGQAVLAWANLPDDIHTIVQEVWNIRLGMRYEREIALDDEGIEMLKSWANDIRLVTTAMNQTREARPGFNCTICPYLLKCDDGQSLISSDNSMIKQYAGAKALTKQLEDILKARTIDKSVFDDNGNEVGYIKKQRRALKDDCIETLSELFYDDGVVDDGARGILYAAGLGVRQVENIIKSISGGEAAAMSDFLDMCFEKINYPEFNIKLKSKK